MSAVAHTTAAVTVRSTTAADGAVMQHIVRAGGVLEDNSRYAYVVMADLHGQTCAVAELDGEPLGFVLGFRIPARPHSLFVWQVGVLPLGRGRGLATQMIRAILDRHPDLHTVEATVAPSNTASRALFTGLATKMCAPCAILPCYTGDALSADGSHEPEERFVVGPISHAGAPNERL